jgi:2-methylcitrate dehydratase
VNEPYAVRLANYARGFTLEPHGPDAVEWAKGILLDTLGCAIAGADGDSCRIIRRALARAGGTPDATVLATGERLPAGAAALANCAAVRYLDCNDTYVGRYGMCHFSEAVPAALAGAERADASGAELLTAIALGYEVLAAFTAVDAGRRIMTLGAVAAPLVAGRLLGLSAPQLAHALGVSLSTNVVLHSWLGDGEIPMIKALAFGSTLQHGIQAAELAAEGFTGPLDAVELFVTAFEGDVRADPVPSADHLTAMDRNLVKAYAAAVFAQGPIEAALALRRAHDLGPADISEVVVTACAPAVARAAASTHRRPPTRESADHSLPFAVAIALVEGDVMPAQYAHEQWRAPEVLALMDRIECRADDALDRRYREAGEHPVRVEIRSRDGRRLVHEVANPRGHPDNPMSVADIEAKFRRLTAGLLAVSRQDAVVELVAGLDGAASVAPLVAAITGT